MINNLAEILRKLRLQLPRFTALSSALILGAFLAAGPSRLAAQESSSRLVRVTVTDPLGRSVTGLEQERFEVIQNGAPCPITDFSGADSPMIVAVVTETPSPEIGSFIRPEDELIQTRSLSDALRQVSSSKKARKVILTSITSGIEATPSGIEVLQTTPASLSDAIEELGELHEYLLWVKPSTPPADLKVVLKQPAGLPPLMLKWK